MPIETLNVNLLSILPMALVAILALSMLVLDFFLKKGDKGAIGYLSIIGLLIVLPIASNAIEGAPAFGGMVIADAFSAFFNCIFILAAVFALYLSVDYLKRINSETGEYYYIVLFAVAGMMVMSSANDLIALYVGIELMALSFYVLTAFRVRDTKSSEGGLKYFVLGALSSGILLYGISFTYGFSGTTNISDIARLAGGAGANNTFMLLGVVLTAAGFAFKIAAFPFHVWAPDAYEGAPTPVTALISIGSKAASFAVFLRVFIVAFPAFQSHWWKLLWALSAATMLYGSVVAIPQKNIIRMLAYSSIAHAGVILIGIVALNGAGAAGVMYYLLVYAFMNMGAFAIVMYLGRVRGNGEYVSDYAGMSSRHPVIAFLMALFLLSLAGIPPTGGFMAKFFILSAAIKARYYWLAAIGVVSTAISLFFYARVVFYMYMKDAEGDSPAPAGRPALAYDVVIYITAAMTMLLGLYPAPFMEIAIKAVEPLIR
ncbi:MAG: NADH-quinone oxidoreductase subunit N [Deltaproteobacteria bacterium]|nr:NADH-quinone oxidoreductase subunit N [Deltaproteobacteria bacterium]